MVGLFAREGRGVEMEPSVFLLVGWQLMLLSDPASCPRNLGVKKSSESAEMVGGRCIEVEAR